MRAAYDLTRNRDLLSGSSFFDAEWYVTRYQDSLQEGEDPIRHYLETGAADGNDPGPEFNTRIYLARRPDVAASGLNPLVHFLRWGLFETAGDLAAYGIGPGATEPVVQRPKGGPKVVFVTHDLNIGGAPRVLASLASWFQGNTDYQVFVIAMGDGPMRTEFESIAPLHVVGYTDVPDACIADLRAAIRTFVGEEPAFTFVNSVASGDYCRIDPFEAPLFAFLHEMPRLFALYQRHASALVQRANHIFCGGPHIYDMLVASGNVTRGQLTTRCAFIDHVAEPFPLSSLDKVARRAALGWSDTKVIVACGVAHWRKQPEVFVRMAANLIKDRGCDVRCVWIGDGEDVPRMKELAAQLGVSERVEWLGFRKDYRALLAAADVFALPSVEDPFPLVCLDAAVASVPSVVFREATGMTALIEPEGEELAGAAVPLGDEAAFFAAAHALLTDDELRQTLGHRARERVLQKYTLDAACAEILQVIRMVAKLPPRVTVAVPSFNAAPYLAKRLDSIASQTFRDVEVILVDDRSSDDSRSVLLNFAAEHPGTRLVLPEDNSGGVFEAWKRCVSMASGDLLWIAESDDWCEPTFLSSMVTAFATSGVHIAHGRSVPVDEQDEVAGDWNAIYLDTISEKRWHGSFVEPARRAVNDGLGIANTIVNASAAVILRSCASQAIEIAAGFRLAGDWAFYLAAARGGRIAYVHHAINYHRRHIGSVTHKIEGSSTYFQELADVGVLTSHLYSRDLARDRRFQARLSQEARRLRFDAPLPTGRILTDLPRTGRRGVLYAVGDLSGGGAQMFAVRFVNKLAAMSIPVVLLVVGYEQDHPATRRLVSPSVPVVSPADIQPGGLARFMDDWGLDVIISGHWWADCLIGERMDLETIGHPWVIVMHGCYENVLSTPDSLPNLRHNFSRAERHCNHWVWTAEKNKRVFEEGYIKPRRTSHIVSGFEASPLKGLGRPLRFADDAIVFTLASRAIEEKGWLVALDAFVQARHTLRDERDVQLLLIGDGPVAQQLRQQEHVEGVTLIHHTSKLADYIDLSHVGLLPSWFAGESLPLVVIEFLAQGKPLIVSDIGMCAWAIEGTTEDGVPAPAGTVLRRSDGKVDASTLASAMIAFARDENLMERSRLLARSASEKFSMDRMINEYMAVFDDLTGEAALTRQAVAA